MAARHTGDNGNGYGCLPWRRVHPHASAAQRQGPSWPARGQSLDASTDAYAPPPPRESRSSRALPRRGDHRRDVRLDRDLQPCVGVGRVVQTDAEDARHLLDGRNDVVASKNAPAVATTDVAHDKVW